MCRPIVGYFQNFRFNFKELVLYNLLNQGNRADFLRLNFNQLKRFNLNKLVTSVGCNVILVYTCFMPHAITVSTCATMFVTTCSKTMFSDKCVCTLHVCISTHMHRSCNVVRYYVQQACANVYKPFFVIDCTRIKMDKR